MNSRPTVLIVERNGHLHVVEQLVKALESNSQPVVIAWTRHGTMDALPFDRNLAFSSPPAHNSIRKLLRLCQFYAKVLRKLGPSDLVVVCTAPESGPPIEWWVFLAMIWPVRTKTLWSVRWPELYARDRTLLDRVRRRVLAGVRAVSTETKRQGQWLSEQVPKVEAIRVVSNFHETTVVAEPPSSTAIIMGLVGGLSSQRRDYAMLYEAIRALPTSISDELCIQILGNRNHPDSDEILSLLASACTVETIGHGTYLDEKEFLAAGATCHFLVAPLRSDSGYGSAKGSGAIADAIRLRRRLVIPRDFDPEEEFRDLLIPYRRTVHDMKEAIQKAHQISSLSPVLPFSVEYSQEFASAQILSLL